MPASEDSKGGRTRQRVLDAARARFAAVGYERATIRDIAVAADVDKSSVMKYFGNKENLFRECVRWEIPIGELTTTDPASSAKNYLRAMLSAWAQEPNTPMAVLLRTSMTSETAANLLRHHMTSASVDAIERHIDGAHARLRAALFAAVMMGIASGRYLIKLPDLAEADLDDVIESAAPLVAALTATPPTADGAPARTRR
ncbi:MAG TPA: TetR family transcriptional regulator [Jatrophihabitans sp.]|jgi:AcrR family transcriptional regulator|uniref:TetR/AcrR family transcriptional regulator n=1 Tax=Jatrophihabitans sp. TaxID=1932789 RepID=UPI002F0787E3